jgi:hypothetical protein
VTVEFETSRVVNFSCDSPLVNKLYRRFAEYDHFDRVGELGFGTNIGISEWIPMNSHIKERRPGLHIGLGGHGQRLEVARLCVPGPSRPDDLGYDDDRQWPRDF